MTPTSKSQHSSSRLSSLLATTVATAGACVVAYSYYYLSLQKANKDTKNDAAVAPPRAPQGLLTILGILGGDQAPFATLQIAQQLDSQIFQIAFPLPGGAYVVGDAAAAAVLLRDGEKPRTVYATFDKLTGQPTLVTRRTADPQWKHGRRGAAPAFGSQEIQRIRQIVVRRTQKWMDATLQPASDGAAYATFDPSTEMVKLSFFILLESHFDYIPTAAEYVEFMKHLQTALHEYTYKQGTNPLRGLLAWFWPEVRQANQSAKFVRNFALKMLQHHRHKHPNNSNHNTLIRLIDENPHFRTDDEKVAELVTYIVAGHDTTGYTMATTLIQIAQHEAIARRVTESLRDLDFANPKPSSNLQYAIQESMRLWPVAAMGTPRLAMQDYTFDTMVHGVRQRIKIPKGATLFLPQILINRNTTVYLKRPTEFVPERWETATVAMKQAAALTFAPGPRNCIGQAFATAEINSVLPLILSQYSLHVDEPGELDFFMTLKYKGTRLKAVPVDKDAPTVVG